MYSNRNKRLAFLKGEGDHGGNRYERLGAMEKILEALTGEGVHSGIS